MFMNTIDVKGRMDIFFSASEEDKPKIKEDLLNEFEKLSDEDKDVARQMFLDDWDTRTKNALENIEISIELARVSEYISLSYIADRFFGKSRQWLNNKLKGNISYGKAASFTCEEIKKLSEALSVLSDEIKSAALKLAS